MPFPLLELAMLALAAPPVPSSAPIYVTAHPWAPFISPMGEPYRARNSTDDTLADWFNRADRNHDGVLTQDEMLADAERFFATLDTNQDRQIDPDELAHYEYEIAPDIQVNSRTRRLPGQPVPATSAGASDDYQSRGTREKRRADDDTTLGLGGALQGAARYGLLNMPEPVAAADMDFNRAISIDEFRQAALARFQLLDTGHQGKLTLAQLEAMRLTTQTNGARRKRGDKAPDPRLGNPLPLDHSQ